MQELRKGHKYVADNFETNGFPFDQEPYNGQIIQFIEKEVNPEDPTGPMVTVNNGTTNEELLKILIHRTEHLQEKHPCEENVQALHFMRNALDWFNLRTARRKSQGTEGTVQEASTKETPKEVVLEVQSGKHANVSTIKPENKE